MTIPEMYRYLIRARRELWTTFEAVPDEVLSRPLLGGERFHCIKDLVMHIAIVEDCWLHEDFLREKPRWMSVGAFEGIDGGPIYADFAFGTLLDYWKAVEEEMLAFLATLTDAASTSVVGLHDAPDELYTLDGLLWHVMLHEVRHTAQICVLLRKQGVKPPSLDLLFYLPRK